MVRLQILIPHYRSGEAIVGRLLRSIELQQGIDMSEVEVLIANDGPPPLPESRLRPEWLGEFSVNIRLLPETDRNHGITHTRNRLMDAATAEYIMFCDDDDMFINSLGLHIAFKEMPYDILTTRFLKERRAEDGGTEFAEYPFDATFVHGKFYRRQYLIDQDIRWNESLRYHEDVPFNEVACACTDDRKYVEVPIYLWTDNPNSVTHQKEFMFTTLEDMFYANCYVVSECARRGKTEFASIAADTYLKQLKGMIASDEYKSVRNELQDYYNEYDALYGDLVKEDERHA